MTSRVGCPAATLTVGELWAGEVALLAHPGAEEAVGLRHEVRAQSRRVQGVLHGLDGLHRRVGIEQAVHAHCGSTTEGQALVKTKAPAGTIIVNIVTRQFERQESE